MLVVTLSGMNMAGFWQLSLMVLHNGIQFEFGRLNYVMLKQLYSYTISSDTI